MNIAGPTWFIVLMVKYLLSIHLDWHPASRRLAAERWLHITLQCGPEHLFRAVERNNRQGCKKRLQEEEGCPEEFEVSALLAIPWQRRNTDRAIGVPQDDELCVKFECRPSTL